MLWPRICWTTMFAMWEFLATNTQDEPITSLPNTMYEEQTREMQTDRMVDLMEPHWSCYECDNYFHNGGLEWRGLRFMGIHNPLHNFTKFFIINLFNNF